jgi:hypothetical protein
LHDADIVAELPIKYPLYARGLESSGLESVGLERKNLCLAGKFRLETSGLESVGLEHS